MNRRNFLKQATMASGSVLLATSGCSTLCSSSRRSTGSMLGYAAPAIPNLRVGVIGLGNRGSAAVRRLTKVPNVTVTAIADLRPEQVVKSREYLKKQGLPEAKEFGGSAEAWRGLVDLADVDLVYVCTSWWTHTPMSLAAMKSGKHAAVEVPAAITLDECWELVETSEKTRQHCMMLENSGYGDNELFILNLCQKRVLGTIVHGDGSYIHEMRASKWREESAGGRQGRWRLEWARQHDGNPYPTHGLGPICQCMDIHCGDRMEYLNSCSTDPMGLGMYGVEKYGADSPEAKFKFKQGDMNTSLIRTARGRTIMLQHDTTTPRPYVRHNLVSGTKGAAGLFPLRVALEPKYQKWMEEEELQALFKQYQHPLWRKQGEKAKKVGGHGGKDYVMDLRLCTALQRGIPLDMDVYDAAAWSSIVELSEISTQRRGAPVNIPDFTRNVWKTAMPRTLDT